MPLASSVKELEAILQKLIKSEPGLIPVDKNDEKHLDDVGDADVLELLDEGQGGGLGATTKRNENCSFTRTRKMRK